MPTEIRLNSHRIWFEAENVSFRKNQDCMRGSRKFSQGGSLFPKINNLAIPGGGGGVWTPCPPLDLPKYCETIGGITVPLLCYAIRSVEITA